LIFMEVLRIIPDDLNSGMHTGSLQQLRVELQLS
jgi:hypothetical protein